nr:MAG TPA: hypothetical protein [Caudoviricetes sp.]
MVAWEVQGKLCISLFFSPPPFILMGGASAPP